ncbi:YdcF family protein [Methylocystis sp. IM3]|jgi:uncharacterized SAM-binding protein YcdF (DUF218 family)|uniref:YdcF family protein n=1 Tax=unclassified Methylocystis TaxID=2625913 RepID=UPI0030FA7387
MLAQIVGRVCLGALVTGVGFGFVAFDDFHTPPADVIRGAVVSIVFTGAFERVDAGLRLLEAGETPRLFISGVNVGAGITPDRFLSIFAPRNPKIADLPWLVACCVEMGEVADNTIENALETRSWLERRKIGGPVVLVTSRLHMARARAALAAEIGRRQIIPYPVEDETSADDPLRQRADEYVKYLATLVLVRFPWLLEDKLLPARRSIHESQLRR